MCASRCQALTLSPHNASERVLLSCQGSYVNRKIQCVRTSRMPHAVPSKLADDVVANDSCSLPSDLVALIFSHLNLIEVGSARLTCRSWVHLGRRNDVLAAAAANTSAHTCIITRNKLQSLLDLTDADLNLLPGRPFVTRRGHTCWLYGPAAVCQGLRLRCERGHARW